MGGLAVGVVVVRLADDEDAKPRATATTVPAPITAGGPTTVTTTTAATSTTTAGATSVIPTSAPRATSATTTTTRPTTVTTALGNGLRQGTWGGKGIRLVITATGATLEFDCATGSIPAPVVLGPGGSFEALGAYTRQRAGPPEPAGTVPPAVPARYSGAVDGTEMQLTVNLTDTTLGPYILVFGQPAALERCT